MNRRVTKAIFPVAGLGTRFLPATKSIPKEIMTLVDRPLIQYAIDEARAAGIKEFIFVTSRGKGALEDYFDIAPTLESELRKKGKTDLLEVLKSTNMESGAIAYIRQHRALGLGHAVWCARRLIANEPFAVILPDDVIAAETSCLKQMVDAYEETGGSMVAAADRLERRIELFEDSGIDTEALEFSAVFCRSLEYYTGFVFQIEDAAAKAIAGGGRYDTMLSDIGGIDPVPAIGCAVYTERLLQQAGTS